MQNEPNDPIPGESVPAASPTIGMSNTQGRLQRMRRAFVRRRELVIFFVLCYLIGWSTLPWGRSSPLRH
ncbi:MAG: hypothetical protein K0S98_494 [Propionibacteriaceae bacterium]|nr:hypothetical protein [Propionibacteriaceae bacterium]